MHAVSLWTLGRFFILCTIIRRFSMSCLLVFILSHGLSPLVRPDSGQRSNFRAGEIAVDFFPALIVESRLCSTRKGKIAMYKKLTFKPIVITVSHSQ
jgi:hypothetical protein